MIYEFPERLKMLRLLRGFNQKQLGEQIGVSQNTISDWENYKKYPAIDRLYDISRVLDCKPSDLLLDERKEF